MTADSPTAQSAAGSLELGWFVLCLSVSDIHRSVGFYELLGFEHSDGEPDEGWAIMNNGATEIGLFQGFGEGTTLNFRGGDIEALGPEHAKRGLKADKYHKFDTEKHPHEWWHDKEGNEVPLEGSGSYSLFDPEKRHVFMDTTPLERSRMLARDPHSKPEVTGELKEGLPLLGHHEYCLNVEDMDACVAFYTKLGLNVMLDNRDEGWAALGYDNPGRCRLALYKGHIDADILNFRGGNVFELAELFKSRGLTIASGPEVESDGSDGMWLTDPDGHKIYFNTSPPERLYE